MCDAFVVFVKLTEPNEAALDFATTWRLYWFIWL